MHFKVALVGSTHGWKLATNKRGLLKSYIYNDKQTNKFEVKTTICSCQHDENTLVASREGEANWNNFLANDKAHHNTKPRITHKMLKQTQHELNPSHFYVHPQLTAVLETWITDYSLLVIFNFGYQSVHSQKERSSLVPMALCRVGIAVLSWQIGGIDTSLTLVHKKKGPEFLYMVEI